MWTDLRTLKHVWNLCDNPRFAHFATECLEAAAVALEAGPRAGFGYIGSL